MIKITNDSGNSMHNYLYQKYIYCLMPDLIIYCLMPDYRALKSRWAWFRLCEDIINGEETM